MMDIDSVEWREGRGIVAFIETADIHSTYDRSWQFEVLRELSERTGIPAYFVRHDQECTVFLVRRIGEKGFWFMTREQYLKFLKEL